MSPAKRPDDKANTVEGRNPVLEALRGPRKVTRVLLAEGTPRTGAIEQIVSLATEQGVPLSEVPRPEFSRLVRTHSPQGVVADVAPYRYATLRELIQTFHDGRVPLVLALDGVEDPQNFGSLLRVADAVGVNGVVTAERRSCPVTAAVSKASAGAVEHVKVVRVANVGSALLRLKEEGLWVIGAEAAGGVPYQQVDFRPPTAVVLGAEGAGLGRLIKERCDVLACIPMAGRVSSLNVATAGAVLMFEVTRQRAE